MEMILKGIKVIVVLRSSLDELAEKSIAQQREACRRYVQKQGLIPVGEEVLWGLSATTGEHEGKLRELHARKINGEDFNGLLFYDLSRFSRIVEDGNRLFTDFADAGVTIISTKEGVKTGKYAWLERGLAIREHEAYGEKLSDQTCRGVMAAMLAKTIPHTPTTPYALDKMYLSAGGDPMFRVRRLPGGRLVKLKALTEEPLAYYEKGHQRKCIVKQSDETITLVKGDPELVNIVNEMYEWHYLKGKGFYWITRELNNRGIPNMKGGLWTTSVVRQILRNTVYIGLGIGCLMGYGVHNMRSAGSPLAMPTPRRPGYGKNGRKLKRVTPTYRMPEDWFMRRYPDLRDFIKKPMRKSVRKAIFRHLKSKIEALRQGRKINHKTGHRYRPENSPYVLSHILHTKQGNVPMTGWPTCGMLPNQKWRYYYTHRGVKNPVNGDPFKARVRADVVEDVVYRAIEEVCSAPEAIGTKLSSFISEYYDAEVGEKDDMKRLLDDKRAVEQQYRLILQCGPRGQQLLAEEARRLESRLNDLDAHIRMLRHSVPIDIEDKGAIAASVVRQFREIGKEMRDRPSAAVRRIVETLVSKLTFDCVTREVELELRLPIWAMAKEQQLLTFIRETEGGVATMLSHTNIGSGLVLLQVKCSEQRSNRVPSFCCSRNAA